MGLVALLIYIYRYARWCFLLKWQHYSIFSNMVFQSTSSFHFVHRFARIFPVLPTIDFNFITKLITILNPVVVNCCASNMGHSNDIVYVSQCESELGFRKAGSGERRKSLQCSVPILLGERKNPIVFVYAFFLSLRSLHSLRNDFIIHVYAFNITNRIICNNNAYCSACLFCTAIRIIYSGRESNTRGS